MDTSLTQTGLKNSEVSNTSLPNNPRMLGDNLYLEMGTEVKKKWRKERVGVHLLHAVPMTTNIMDFSLFLPSLFFFF